MARNFLQRKAEWDRQCPSPRRKWMHPIRVTRRRRAVSSFQNHLSIFYWSWSAQIDLGTFVISGCKGVSPFGGAYYRPTRECQSNKLVDPNKQYICRLVWHRNQYQMLPQYSGRQGRVLLVDTLDLVPWMYDEVLLFSPYSSHRLLIYHRKAPLAGVKRIGVDSDDIHIIPGTLLPGNPMANMVLKAYPVQTLSEADKFCAGS
ncbi:hypothetical protein C8R42DRAFT_649107 [Lentinula raphanica]|nr:hypothetical protein C8R42DRAFT_649107 [Lentinula raphanica]